MKSTLADTLQIVLPHLSPALAVPEAIASLQKTARLLAPIPRGGFECRLGSEPQVDLQQCIVAGNGEAALLREHLGGMINRDARTDKAWARLHDFITQWSEPSSDLHHEISEIWLEFDADFPKGSSDLPLPSLFFGLQQEATAIDKRLAVTERALDLLLGRSYIPPSTSYPSTSGYGLSSQQNWRRCFEACPEGVFISHIGVMISRPTEALRVNVKRLHPEMLIPYLEGVGWQGPTDELQRLMVELYDQVDRITVCLDVGRQIYPKIGLECILLKQPPQEPRWVSFLAYLVERGWCTPKKQAALLKWPGHSHPTTTAKPWPTHLITASLLQPPDRFSVFERRLSHIKIVYRPQCVHRPEIRTEARSFPLLRPVLTKEGMTNKKWVAEAKGYLWFSHEWQRVPRRLNPKARGTKG